MIAHVGPKLSVAEGAAEHENHESHPGPHNFPITNYV